MKMIFGIVCLPILLSGCAPKIIREYYTNPERIIYVEQPVQKVAEASSVPVPTWVVVVITFIVSFILFMLIGNYIKRIRNPR